jgi:glycolate oxidase iron-sulfur subunit
LTAILQKEIDANFKYNLAAQAGGENIKRCFACGACTGGCLISETAGVQFDPRKIIRMITLGMKDEVLSSPAIWLCLLCHNCSFHCPQDVRFSDVISALRYLAVKEGYIHPSFLRKIIFQALLPSQTRLELFSRPLTLYHALRLPSLVRKSKVLSLLPERLGSLEKLLPPFPLVPLRSRLKTVTPAKGKMKQRVGFFLGCADNLVFASSGLATVSILSENHCEVVVPKQAECCGMPCLGYGEIEQAKQLARHNIDVFRKVQTDVIVTDCATCGSTLKGYANLLKNDPDYAEYALAFSQKVQDISEFLAPVISRNEKFKEIKGKVTYHDSCHLLWSQNISFQPRQILNLIPGLELVEMKESGTCCGGAGSYNITHYETSMSILDRKMTNVAATGANLLAAGCPGCRLQLSLGIKRRGLKAEVVHPIELLNKAYSGM